MTGTPCCVRVCHSNTKFTRNVSWHEFPTDERMRRIWIERVRKMRQHKTWLPQPYTKICGFHFNKSGFKSEADRIPVYIGRLRKKKFNNVPIYRNGPENGESTVQDEVFNEHSYFRRKHRPPLKKPASLNRKFPIPFTGEIGPMLSTLTPPSQKSVLRTERKLVPVSDILVKYFYEKCHTPKLISSTNKSVIIKESPPKNSQEENILFLPETHTSTYPQTSNSEIQNKLLDPLEGAVLDNGDVCENNFVSVKTEVEVEEPDNQEMEQGDPLELELSSEDDTKEKDEDDTLLKENNSLRDENTKLHALVKKLNKDLSESLQREEKYKHILSSAKALSVKFERIVNMKIETDCIQVKQEFDC